MFRSRRPQTSLFLALCGITLLISIFVGKKMGERVLGRTTETAVVVPAVTTTPVPLATQGPDSGPIRDWRKLQVVTVATDPGFPDPRVTPTPKPTPKPTRTPTPEPTPPPVVITPEGSPGLPSGSPAPGQSSLQISTPPPGGGG